MSQKNALKSMADDRDTELTGADDGLIETKNGGLSRG
jgi:hypothetical protein